MISAPNARGCWSSAAASAVSARRASSKMPTSTSCSSTSNDYHTFQPLLYQVATDLLETAAVGHPLRDLFHDQPNVDRAPGTVTGDRPRRATVEFDELQAARVRLPRARARRERQLLRDQGAAKHAFPMYTLADAVRLKEHVLERWEAADRDPELSTTARSTWSSSAAAPTGVESVGALAELYREQLRQGLPARSRRSKARADPRRGRARRSSRCSSRTSASTRTKALEKRGVEVMVGEAVAVDRADAREAQVGQGAEGPHARLGRGAAGERRSCSRSGRARARQPRRRSGRT